MLFAIVQHVTSLPCEIIYIDIVLIVKLLNKFTTCVVVKGIVAR